MSGAGRQRRSRGELIRQRARAQFVGRRAQLSLFTENLVKDPESEGDPAEFLFHVRGVGGIGKSTLLRQWQQAAQRAGAVTAVVDENDVHDVHQASAELARQLAEQSGPLKEFDRAAEQYRREQEAAPEPVLAESNGASVSSRMVTQAALGAASLIPGAGVVTAMTNPDTAAQGLDRLRAGVRARAPRGHRADAAGVSRAFVAELARLCERHRWVVLFLDTWEQTGRYLDGWLRDLLEDAFGPVPVNVMVVLAGRDELAEREWALLRAQVVDVPLEVFTEAETRTLLAARGVSEPSVVEAVLQLSMGLPLLVELLALTRPGAAEDVDAGGDVVDAAVERFVQWITDPLQRETVLACALAPQLNEDVFAAAVPPEARELWGWLCGQPFVSGRGDFKQYHAVVRASMVHQQRTRSPQGWITAHLQLADAHAAWRTDAEQGLVQARRWSDPRWLRHRLDETYHRLCAHPSLQLTEELEQAVHAAGQDTAVLRQWTDAFEQAARDTADPALLTWADRLQDAVTAEEPALAFLTALLTHRQLSITARSWAYTYRGRYLYLTDHDEEALAEFDRAIATDPDHARAWAYRGDAHRWLNHADEAVNDLTTALRLSPNDAWALASRGDSHREAGRYDQAITDLTAAIDLHPAYAWALGSRGQAHRDAGRYDWAITDLTAALHLHPDDAWALASRGEAHCDAGHYDQAITDLTAAIDLHPTFTWAALGSRGQAHRLAGRYDQAITDLTAAIDLHPTYAWALAQRGETHRETGQYDRAVADFTASLHLDPDDAWALASRGQAHRQAGRYDQAITDLTAAIDLHPDDAWILHQRGVAHRQTGRYSQAREDLERAVESEPSDPGLLFEMVLLDAVGSEPAACIDQWTQLLNSPVETPTQDGTRFFDLFRVLLLEPGSDVTDAAEVFLSGGPDHDAITDLLHYLAEFSAVEDGLADRARRCRQLIVERTSE
ncbi:tetratricopeptide repeat protein [Streptomyces canus]|uniref:tetratricopeptide repeat protein n=1 Tax=Streptomyces canus TaxID=58343 RepID=UPI002DD82D8E|nr:tetratricopeptide repeat protein [Streptomyces canus]WSD82855.1 tetratricopeptide repeat protein [Streptomyces canus]WSD91979.1 tetratricopeptide repeat protein [Streptomyces canus]WSD92530.1 tetratricopeptide repeat protein [Streptomyces canus]